MSDLTGVTSQMTSQQFDQIFNGIEAGAQLGMNIAHGIQEMVDPDSRRVSPGGYQSQYWQGGQQMQPQRQSYGYGYGDPSGMFQQSMGNYPGLSNPSYGKGGAMR